MKFLQFIAALFIGALMLFSTTGVRISQHWCGERLVNATIWGNAEPCEHFNVESKPVCPMHAKKSTKKKCCNEREVQLDAQEDDFSGSQALAWFPTITAFIVLGTDARSSIEFPQLIQEHFRNHSPPLLTRALYLLAQNFRI